MVSCQAKNTTATQRAQDAAGAHNVMYTVSRRNNNWFTEGGQVEHACSSKPCRTEPSSSCAPNAVSGQARPGQARPSHCNLLVLLALACGRARLSLRGGRTRAASEAWRACLSSASNFLFRPLDACPWPRVSVSCAQEKARISDVFKQLPAPALPAQALQLEAHKSCRTEQGLRSTSSGTQRGGAQGSTHMN